MVCSWIVQFLNESGHKPSKIWIDEGSGFYNTSMKSLLQDSDLKIYSTHNKLKSVVAERFFRILKNKIIKYMNSNLRYLYINKLKDKFNKCNNTYYITIKMKHIDVKTSIYIDFDVGNQKKLLISEKCLLMITWNEAIVC